MRFSWLTPRGWRRAVLQLLGIVARRLRDFEVALHPVAHVRPLAWRAFRRQLHGADAFDPQLDDVAGLDPLAAVYGAAEADGTGRDHVAGVIRLLVGGVRHELGEEEVAALA